MMMDLFGIVRFTQGFEVTFHSLTFLMITTVKELVVSSTIWDEIIFGVILIRIWLNRDHDNNTRLIYIYVKAKYHCLTDWEGMWGRIPSWFWSVSSWNELLNSYFEIMFSLTLFPERSLRLLGWASETSGIIFHLEITEKILVCVWVFEGRDRTYWPILKKRLTQIFRRKISVKFVTSQNRVNYLKIAAIQNN